MIGAVAVDFGASSARFAAGRLVDGRIEYDVIRQVEHGPIERNGHLYWDFNRLLAFCQEAVEYADQTFTESTVGIDSWGVDHGFVDSEGNLIEDPVCYRDLSHVAAFESLQPLRRRLYELTGCQHQPFNTICQLLARRREDPTLPERALWMILPDLLGHGLVGKEFVHHEFTQASTTQLLGLDGRWSVEAFEMVGWPVPDVQPEYPGGLGPSVRGNVRLAYVGSHDTASAVAGLGNLADTEAFLNVGTWSLLGCLNPNPIASVAAEDAGFTNERAVDGSVRFLKNIPGFYVINRIHEELGIRISVPEWLLTATGEGETVDLLHESFYNPESMLQACRALVSRPPETEREWAGFALSSLTQTITEQIASLERLTGRKIQRLRVGGGGSQSELFCRSLADATGIEVWAGPAESTVLGNLAVQYLALGQIANDQEMREILERSSSRKVFNPSAF